MCVSFLKDEKTLKGRQRFWLWKSLEIVWLWNCARTEKHTWVKHCIARSEPTYKFHLFLAKIETVWKRFALQNDTSLSNYPRFWQENMYSYHIITLFTILWHICVEDVFHTVSVKVQHNIKEATANLDRYALIFLRRICRLICWGWQYIYILWIQFTKIHISKQCAAFFSVHFAVLSVSLFLVCV